VIASCTNANVDTTPRKDGKLGGCAWTLVPDTDPETWTNLGDLIACPPANVTVRVSWDVRARNYGVATTAPILSVGQAWVKNVANDSVIVEQVETFTDPRVEFHVNGSSTSIQVQSHLTEGWEFQVRLAYEKASVPA
jgi:hypothetical protein